MVSASGRNVRSTRRSVRAYTRCCTESYQLAVSGSPPAIASRWISAVSATSRRATAFSRTIVA